MPDKEATARIKINRLLEAAGWRFFQEGTAPANIRLEPNVTFSPDMKWIVFRSNMLGPTHVFAVEIAKP